MTLTVNPPSLFMHEGPHQYQVSTYSVSHSSHSVCVPTHGLQLKIVQLLDGRVCWRRVESHYATTYLPHLNAKGRFLDQIHYYHVTSLQRVWGVDGQSDICRWRGITTRTDTYNLKKIKWLLTMIMLWNEKSNIVKSVRRQYLRRN